MLFLWKIGIIVLTNIVRCDAFVTRQPLVNIWNSKCRDEQWKLHQDEAGTEIDISTLMTMDVVIFSETNQSTKRKLLGAVQDDGRITTLSVWTMEPAFGNSLECLVDEEDMLPGFQPDKITVHAIVPQNLLSYGSRQVGGGMGPGNPHGEESELLYYVDQSLLNEIEVTIKPELEIFW